jgi:hypothetical protein
MNSLVVPCPKCRLPGILYADWSMHALIGSRHVAHVFHPGDGSARRMCLLKRFELEAVSKPDAKVKKGRRHAG